MQTLSQNSGVERKPCKVIIFSEFAEMCKIIHQELNGSLMIIGETPTKERQEIIEEFKNNSEKQILILSSAGQYGLNLQSAEAIIHFDQAWSLGKMTQREGRAARMGQKKAVLVYSLIARKTMDEYVRRVLRKKQEVADRVLMTDIREMLE